MLRRLIPAISLLLASAVTFAQERVADVIYAKRAGVALTLDVFKPAKPNGSAVIWIVSGGWVSTHDGINPGLAQPFNDRGITLIQVVHGAQPKYTIPEIVDQIQRSVRYVRTNAAKFAIDPNRIGITGGSAGGHLSLMVAGLAGEGRPSATDPVDRASAAVQAVVAYFPPTDFEHFGTSGGQKLFTDPNYAIFVPAFGLPKDATPEKLTEIAKKTSPLLLVTPKFPPTMLVHGDKDTLVPLQQSQVMDEALGKAGVVRQLVVVPGGGHDGNVVLKTLGQLLDWFAEKLK